MWDVVTFKTIGNELNLKPNVHLEMSKWLTRVTADFITGFRFDNPLQFRAKVL